MNKINIAMILNDFNLNGISMVVLNYCKHLNLKKFNITIITGTPAESSNLNECKKHGINVVILPSRKKNSFSFYKSLSKELSKKKYDIVHVHGNSAMITPELFIAYIKGIKIRIAHSHNSTCNHLQIHRILLPIFNKLYTHGFACSSLAGEWMFKKNKYYVIPNGFEVEKFKFDLPKRLNLRKELKLEDNYVVGHIGRFNEQKNHLYLLDIFKKVAVNNSNAVLLLVGNGPDYDKIKKVIEGHPYKDRIILYGETSHTEEIYNVMDVFVFPSKYEGLGIVLLEAQINGLTCITSDVVPKDVILSNEIKFLPLGEENIDKWAIEISGNINSFRNENKKLKHIELNKYDINSNAEYLSNLYSDFYDKKNN